MKETYTLRQVLEIHAGLSALAERRLPAVSSYRVARALAAVTPERGVYLQQRNELIEEHGKEKDGTITIEPGTPEMAAFNADEERLLAEELELEIPRIRVEDLVEIEPKWVAMMLPIIEEGQG